MTTAGKSVRFGKYHVLSISVGGLTHVLIEIPLLNEAFNLPLQFVTVEGIVTVVLVKVAELRPVAFLRVCACDWAR